MGADNTARHGGGQVNALLALVGAVLMALALGAEFIGLDITPGFGVVQMGQLLIGLALLTLAAFLHVRRTRRRGMPRSLQADIGVRLAAMGLVFAYVAGLSDLIGIGTHITPSFERPFVGPLQLGGIGLGVLSIVAGILLYSTSRSANGHSSLEFLISQGEEGAPEAAAPEAAAPKAAAPDATALDATASLDDAASA